MEILLDETAEKTGYLYFLHIIQNWIVGDELKQIIIVILAINSEKQCVFQIK